MAAITKTDLENATVDVQFISNVANGGVDESFVSRLGQECDSVAKAIETLIDQATATSEYAAAALAAQAGAEEAEAGAISAALGVNYFQEVGARSYVPQGAVGHGAITAGSGGTNGTFAAVLSGGNYLVDPTVMFTVAGNVLTAVDTTPGRYYGASPTAPTLSFAASAGLTGAACALTSGYLIGGGNTYYAPHATDATLIAQFQNQANVAVEVDASVDWMSVGQARAWAESATAPDGGTGKSAKTWAAEAAASALSVASMTARMQVVEHAVGAPHTPGSSPTFFDPFTTSGNLNGRTGWEVRCRPTFSSQINAITASGGFAGGTTGTAAYALTTAPSIDSIVRFRMGVAPIINGGISLFTSVAENGVTNYSHFQVSGSNTTLSNVPTGVLAIRPVVEGSAGSILQQATVRMEVGDTISYTPTTTGGVTSLVTKVNGQQVMAAVTISGMSVPLTPAKHGFIGSAGAATMDSVTVVNPATDSSIGLFCPWRTVPKNADGSATWRFSGTYTGSAPFALHATLYDRASGSPVAVSAYTGVYLTNFTAANGVWSGKFTVAAASLPTGNLEVGVVRDGLIDGAGALAQCEVRTPIQRIGYAFMANGQSLAVNASRQNITTSPTYTAPANAYWQGGEPTSVSVLGADYTRLFQPVGSDTTAGALAQAIDAGDGLFMTVASGGVAAQAIAARAVGTACHNALLEALNRMGGYFHFMQHTDGQSDLTNDVTAYIAALNAIYADLDTRMGQTARCLLNPIASGWGNSNSGGHSDEQWQLMRRTHRQLCTLYPTRFFEGANVLDIQHDTGANGALHFAGNGSGEFQRRAGHAIRKALGLQANTRNGPLMYSVQKLSTTSTYVVYDLRGADSLELVNTATGGYHGGMIFSDAATVTSGTIANKIFPSNAVVDASPSGGYQGITFTHSAIAGTIYIWAAYGRNPFNPTDDTTLTDPINLDMNGKASMIRGIYGSEPHVAMRPYFGASTIDYLTAS